MLNRLQSLDTIDAPFAFGERILPPAPVAAIAPKAVADWTRATVADMANVLTDDERSALAEAFPPVSRSSDSDPCLRGVAERMATAKPDADGWIEWAGPFHEAPPKHVAGRIVAVRCQSGDEPNPQLADVYDWNTPNYAWAGIVAYRVVPQ